MVSPAGRQDTVNFVFWSATWAGKVEPCYTWSRSELPMLFPQENFAEVQVYTKDNFSHKIVLVTVSGFLWFSYRDGSLNEYEKCWWVSRIHFATKISKHKSKITQSDMKAWSMPCYKSTVIAICWLFGLPLADEATMWSAVSFWTLNAIFFVNFHFVLKARTQL